MATESNATGLHPSTFSMSRHAISFQSGASMSASSEMVPMMGSNYFGVNSGAAAGMIFASAGTGNSNTISHSTGLTHAGAGTATATRSASVSPSGSSSLLLDSVPGLKHENGFAVEWSVDEQYKLEEGLKKLADEPSIMKYIKIAALLQNKTVRDVALRCRWMTRKRRKPEEHSPGKKANNRKDKSFESSKVASNMPVGIVGYSPFIHQTQKVLVPFEGLCGNTRPLLEQNTQAFSQITSNLHKHKLQENVDLFCRARNNIAAMLIAMRDMPGLMSQMPPLPVSLDEDLANSLLLSGSHPLMFGSSSGGMHLKQEPRC